MPVERPALDPREDEVWPVLDEASASFAERWPQYDPGTPRWSAQAEAAVRSWVSLSWTRQ